MELELNLSFYTVEPTPHPPARERIESPVIFLVLQPR